jgi:hypothetical protein
MLRCFFFFAFSSLILFPRLPLFPPFYTSRFSKSTSLILPIHWPFTKTSLKPEITVLFSYSSRFGKSASRKLQRPYRSPRPQLSSLFSIKLLLSLFLSFLTPSPCFCFYFLFSCTSPSSLSLVPPYQQVR